MNQQIEFRLGISEPAEGYNQWVARRQAIEEELRQKLSSPVGHPLEASVICGPVSHQTEIGFQPSEPAEGYNQWLARRQAMAEQLGRKLSLPVGHPVEVWLRGGVRLRGRLRFQEDFLVTEEEHVRQLVLVVDGVPFNYGDIESCVRQD